LSYAGVAGRRKVGAFQRRRGTAGLGFRREPNDRTATVGMTVSLIVRLGAAWTAVSVVGSVVLGRALRVLDRVPRVP